MTPPPAITGVEIPAVLFGLSSPASHLAVFEPVVEVVRRRIPGTRCFAVSGGEFHGYDTDTARLRQTFDRVWLAQDVVQRRGFLRFRKYLHYMHHGRDIQAARVAEVRRWLRRLLRRHQVRAVVLANDRSFPDRALLDEAHRAGIPVLLVQESIRKDFILPQPQGTVRHGQGGADRIAAWGETSAAYYRDVGVPDGRVSLTGSPRLATFLERARNGDRQAVRQTLGLPVDGRVVVFATNPVYTMSMLEPGEYRTALMEVADACAAVDPPVSLVVKPHPLELRDHVEWGLAAALRARPNVRYAADLGLSDALTAADAVLVFNSTVAIEAALLGRQIATLNLTRADLGLDFAGAGVGVELTDLDGLRRFVRGDDTGQVTGVDRFVDRVEGAAEAVADELIGMFDTGAVSAGLSGSGALPGPVARQLVGVTRHAAHCTGLPQLVYLTTALERAGVELSRVVVYPHGGSAANDNVVAGVIAAALRLGMRVGPIHARPHGRGRIALERLLRRRRTALWFCRGVASDPNVLATVGRALPDRFIEYYDGFRSPVVALEDRGPTLRRVRRLGVLNWLIARLLRPHAYFMPSGRLWTVYAGSRKAARTAWLSPRSIRASLPRVSEAWAADDAPATALPPPEVAVAAGVFSERSGWCSQEDEIDLNRDLLTALRRAVPEGRLLLKTHPRSDPEKVRRLEAVCRDLGVEFASGPAPLEHLLEERGATATFLVAPPSTTLLNARTFGHGQGCCLGPGLLSTYLGPLYLENRMLQEDHDLMAASGVPQIETLNALTEQLEMFLHPL